MEPRRCASAASDHSDSMASSREQHCSQMPQQMVYNVPSQGHPHHLAANSHIPPQQGHVMPPQQQLITAEPSVHFGQAQAARSPADYSPVCSAMTGEVSLHPALTTSVQPNNQPYSEVKSYQRHNSSREPIPVYGNMSGSVVSMISPNALHQNVEGMNVPGHMLGGDRHLTHGGYYRVPYHGQHMPNSSQMSWQGQRHCMPPGGHGVVPSHVHVSGVQARFNNQMSVPLRGQHPHYALNQEYRDNVYCQQYPAYGELTSGSIRGTFPPQQRCVGPDGQQMMFARPVSMHAAHHHSRMPVENQFVCYTPHTAASAASPHLSPAWSGSTHTMRTGVPVGYGNQPGWQRPLAVAYGSPLPRQHMHGYHISPEPRMNTEHCHNFGGVRQHLSPPQSFSAGSVHCYRPSSNQAVHTGMANVDSKYIGTAHLVADGNPCGTPASQEYVSPIVTSSNVSTAVVCSPVVSDVSSKDTVVMTTDTTTPSHSDGRTSALHSSHVSGMPTCSLSSCNDPGFYVQGTNVNGSWSTSCTGEYYLYSAASQRTQHQSTSRHINPYGYYTPSSRPPYSGIRPYPVSRCGHPYQSCAEEMQWQGHVAEHPLHESRHVLCDKLASQHQFEEHSPTTVAITASSESTGATSAVNVSAHVSSKSVVKQNLSDTDTVHSLQSAALNSGYHMPFPGAAYPVTAHRTVCSPVSSPVKCCSVSEVVVTASASPQTLPASSMNSAHVIQSTHPDLSFRNKDMHDKSMNNVVAVAAAMESQQITSDTPISSYKSSKGPKRSSTRKSTAKTKKKKTNLTTDVDKCCLDSTVVTYADNVQCDAVRSSCSASSISLAATHQKISGLVESADRHCPVTSSSEQAAVIVPYGWRRHVDSDTVVYYRLQSEFCFCLQYSESVDCLTPCKASR